MQSLDLQVLEDVLTWCRHGRQVDLVTVVETWGSAPRPTGSIAAIRADGLVTGSVSGGCIEADLVAKVRRGPGSRLPTVVTYGVTQDEAARSGLPCGGTLRLVQEPVRDWSWIAVLLNEVRQQHLTRRILHVPSGTVTLTEGRRHDEVAFDGTRLSVTFGPRWRLLLIGAGQLSRAVADMAVALDFEVLVCDPREEYSFNVNEAAMRLLPGMPDEVVRQIRPDPHTAIVALTHDHKLDDMALIEALASSAFYVGALGSARSTAARKARLQLFDMDDTQIDRLHGPSGLSIGSRTPAEIALSILAEIVAVRNHSRLPDAPARAPATASAPPPQLSMEVECRFATS